MTCVQPRPWAWFLVVPLLVAACATPAQQRDSFIASGDAFMAQKKYAEAVIEYRRALQQDPVYGPGYTKLGNASTAAEDPREALAAYVRASDLLPNDVEVNLKAGNLLLVARRFQDAKTRARNVLNKDPKNVPGLVLLGNTLAGLQSMDEAVDVAKRAAALSPDRAGLLNNLGVYELSRGKTDLAEQAFKRAVELSPNQVGPLMALANLYQTIGRNEESEKVLRKALAIEPRNVFVNGSMATTLINLRRAAEAEPFLKIAADAIGTTQASAGLADYYVSVGRTGDALALLQKLSGTPEGFALARVKTAVIDYAEGRRDQAHKALREVLAKEPKNGSALALESRLLLAESRFDEATAVATAALTADPNSSAAYFALGKINRAKGAQEDARKSFAAVLNIDPGRADAQIELSQIHLERRELDTAINYAATAVRFEPDNMDARLALVRALSVRPDDLPKADAELKGLATRYPLNPDVQTMLGVIALQRLDRNGARASFERALKADPDHVEALSGLTTLDAESGRMPAARSRVESLIGSTKTPSADLLFLAAKIYVASGQPDRAEATLRQITEVDPTNLEAFNLLGQFYVVRNKLPQARTEYANLVGRAPTSATAQTMLGLLAQADGDVTGARKAYEAAVRIDPRSATASNNLAWILANTEGADLEIALQYAQSARSRMPSSAAVADTLGYVYYKRNMGAFALPLLQDAISKDPRNPTYQYHLGLVYAQDGEDAKARRAFEAALKLNPQFDGAEHARRVMATLIY